MDERGGQRVSLRGERCLRQQLGRHQDVDHHLAHPLGVEQRVLRVSHQRRQRLLQPLDALGDELAELREVCPQPLQIGTDRVQGREQRALAHLLEREARLNLRRTLVDGGDDRVRVVVRDARFGHVADAAVDLDRLTRHVIRDLGRVVFAQRREEARELRVLLDLSH